MKVHLRKSVTHTYCGRAIERIPDVDPFFYSTVPPVTGLNAHATCFSCLMRAEEHRLREQKAKEEGTP